MIYSVGLLFVASPAFPVFLRIMLGGVKGVKQGVKRRQVGGILRERKEKTGERKIGRMRRRKKD